MKIMSDRVVWTGSMRSKATLITPNLIIIIYVSVLVSDLATVLLSNFPKITFFLNVIIHDILVLILISQISL